MSKVLQKIAKHCQIAKKENQRKMEGEREIANYVIEHDFDYGRLS